VLIDLLIENARIHTGDPRQPVVDSLAVLNGHVIAVGEHLDGVQARERVDARKRTVLPGFNDAHAHTVWFGTTLMETDLSGVGSLDDIYRILAERAASTGPDDWIVASGFNPVLLRGAHPDRDVLDQIAGGRPVWIKHASGHSCQVNGAGLRRTAILEHLDSPLEGGRIVVAEAGRPTGWTRATWPSSAGPPSPRRARRPHRPGGAGGARSSPTVPARRTVVSTVR